MKRILLFAFMLATAFTSCTGDEDSQVTEKTSLELTLKDEDGNVITDGIGFARLYPTENDWSYDTNQIGEPAFADANGKMFASLIPFAICCVVFMRSASGTATAVKS